MSKALYLELMKRVLTDQIHHPSPARLDGTDWPTLGFTMIGMARLDNLAYCVETLLAEEVHGDVLEAGVWRGGAAIYLRALFRAYGVTDRTVWLADSFAGLPPPKPQYPLDAADKHHLEDALAVSLETVKANFETFDLLDQQVKFLKGWFHETLYEAPVKSLALLRLDGDMYESTWVTLDALYDRVSKGGFIVVDDYGYIESCRRAVHDFLAARNLAPRIHKIDWTGVYWRK